MFGTSTRQNEKLDESIDMVLLNMNQFGPDSPEYPELLKSLERLYKLRFREETQKRVSPDVIFTVGGNLLCVLIIVAYEQKNVISSKAMTFVARLTNRP